MPPIDPTPRRRRPRPEDTGPARRARWKRDQAGLDPGELYQARERAHETRAAAAAAGVESGRGGEVAGMAPVLGGTNWTPLGPSVVLRGQARARPAVSGRIVSIEVGPLGARGYVAAADGGAWQYDLVVDGAGSTHDVWTPIDDFATSPGFVNVASGNALAASALYVQFGATARADTILVGTGEPGDPNRVPTQLPRDYYGIGVRVSPGAAAGGRAWHTEATHLAGQATYRLRGDPDDPDIVWAATSAGLFVRPKPGGPGVAWAQVGNAGAGPLPAGREITDVVITGTTAAATKAVFAAVHGRGVYRSRDNGVTWALLPVTPASAANPGRIVLAVSDVNQVVYRFDSLGRLWRFDGVRLRRVQTLPPANDLVGTQGWWDLALAVVPGTDDTVFIGGSLVLNNDPGPVQPADWDAAVYRSALVTAGAERRFGFANAGNADHDPTWVGEGIHPDVHVIAFARNAAGTAFVAGPVWVGCDGGVFMSPTGVRGTFRAANESLAITQPTYFDQHPASDAIVFAGTQDNGTIRGAGSATWRLVLEGDGGGTAVDPNNPLRVLTQWTGSTLYAITDGGLSGAFRAVSPPIAAGFENPPMYSRLTASPPVVEPDTMVLYPTNRIWVTYDFGATWRVLPRNVTPGPASPATSRLNGANDMISDVVWIIRDRFHVSTGELVFRFDRTSRDVNHVHTLDVWTTPPTQLAVTGLPAVPRRITSLAVFNPAADDLCIGLGGAGTGTDHVWWFDQTAPAQWLPTGFGPGLVINGVATPFDAPVTAMVADPVVPGTIYVGTDVGVFRGVRAGVAPAFVWAWTLVSNGLPEATVFDLKIHAASRRLRATLHGRGIWELDLSGAVTPSPDVSMRMHDGDGGRHLPTVRVAPHPFQPSPRTVNWTMSPDVKVRRTTSSAQLPPPFPGASVRFATPRQAGTRVTCIQAHLVRRGFNIGADAAGTFDVGTRQAARDAQSRYGLVELVPGGGAVVDGIVGQRTWAAVTSYPILPASPLNAVVFTDGLGEDTDLATDEMIADAGVNAVFVQVHNRGHLPIAAGDLRVALLLTASDAVGTAPQLPADYAARIRAGDTSAWLAGSGWMFVDPAFVYRSNGLELNARRSAVLMWPVDFTALGFAAGGHVLLVALASATSPLAGATDNTLQAVERNVQTLIEGAGANAGETKAVARLLRLDAVVAIPPP